VTALVERSDRQHFSAGDDALAATAMHADLEHAMNLLPSTRRPR
jgi:hypothetical protein